jgi:hypothetical protein
MHMQVMASSQQSQKCILRRLPSGIAKVFGFGNDSRGHRLARARAPAAALAHETKHTGKIKMLSICYCYAKSMKNRRCLIV